METETKQATQEAQVDTTTEAETTETKQEESVELAKLRSELAKQKAALDKATKEAGDYRKALRAKQSEEEIAAEEKKAADEARDKELAELRKKFAVAETSKQIMKFVADEAVSSRIAEDLYGAADVDAAIAAFQKAWAAKEKALRLEFGKIPAPGAGSSDGPTVTKEQLDAMSYRERVEFATKHPDEYNKLMGR